MDSIQIGGQYPLKGEVGIQGSKNITLPILAATILVRGTTTLHNCPKIVDILHMIRLLESLGANITWEDHTLNVDTTDLLEVDLPKEYVETMRSSVVLLGPMLASYGSASLYYPGGCVIGKRPIDLHKYALEQLNVKWEDTEYGIQATTTGLKGGKIDFPFPSVGATQNAIMAAIFAKGQSIINNPAMEPEVLHLISFLNKAGGKIGINNKNQIVIEGVERLHSIEFEITSDRIVAGTYLLGGIATNGEIYLKNCPINEMDEIIKRGIQLGGTVTKIGNDLLVKGTEQLKALPYIETRVFPGFPTDLQSQTLAVLACAKGTSCIKETIFENRFRVVREINKMGGDIFVRNNIAVVNGVFGLTGRIVEAKELRGGAALVLAGLMAEGRTIVQNKHFINRGYEDIVGDFRLLGARIRTI